MSEQIPFTHRVVMAKRVAAKWIEEHSVPEYRLNIYRGSSKASLNLPGLLKSFRDGKVKFASVHSIPDLGVRPEFDHVVVKSKDYDALTSLDAAVQRIGCETSGVY